MRVDDLARCIALLAASAPDLRTYRDGVLDALAARGLFDAAMMHAGSPRVPLETAAVRGLDPARLAASTVRWDAWAVELGRLRDVALARGGVASDREALPTRGAARVAFDAAMRAALGRRPRATALVHLVVRGRIVALLVLVRWRDRPYDEAELSLLRALAPMLAAGDALHARLDGAPRAAVMARLVCSDGRLTPRQRQIVEHVALGHTNAAIASALELSPNTVRNLLASVMKRLGAANRADVVRLAVLRPD
ncbi:helix-turn-helix transcriptional regulator [Sandaracinus amylolyticus]|uniref:HTH luxR-type domain-containing protein n=1 Tax=Sandaracinus amylolyticus TaxID=927083 RepID=A0A0F6YN19_9BACT|nr:helix-turn-helix transcriptional regulator [Sandaracinus amylolyticus]AKF10776.1 hypothetical protein DB32_007925 [Sandaracinus amylolyticus]